MATEVLPFGMCLFEGGPHFAGNRAKWTPVDLSYLNCMLTFTYLDISLIWARLIPKIHLYKQGSTLLLELLGGAMFTIHVGISASFKPRQ